MLIKQPYLIYRRLTSNLFVTKRKSMVAFNIRVLLLSSKELSPHRRVGYVEKRPDKKAKFNFKIYDVTELAIY